ncbi:MAG TPA: aryl-sulfate sulfotransferase [Verrucomicrobiae bacterium]|nr:aryl-sulfate sulfotransferase [Verrucomicrobiae bacterium]
MRKFAVWALVALVAGVKLASAQSASRAAGYLYLSPVPSASYVSSQTRYFLVRFTQVSPLSVSNLFTDFITVNGETSGSHSGTTKVASDGKTVIFETGTAFVPNEFVTVSLNPVVAPANAGNVSSFEYQFLTDAPFPGSVPFLALPGAPTGQAPTPVPPTSARKALSTLKAGVGRKAMRMANGVSVPSDFPAVQITANTNPSPGYLFLENGLDGVPPYTMMLDNNGLPIWYRRGRMYDFKIQRNGMITWCLSDDTGFPAFDQNFNYIKTYATTNGYSSDGHELKILPDGRYFMIGYQTNSVDMSQYIYGFYQQAIVRETVVQEFTAADELIFQWRAWDNYNLSDLGGNSDFPHMNGLDIDEDGNLLVSARHLSEVTKVDLQSGDVIWRLGGAASDFSFVNDPLGGTSYQHNISALGNGHYMVFDNGDTRNPPVSRAAEFALDLQRKTASLVWQFRDSPDKYAFWMGSSQRLPSGNTLIDFVLPQYPKVIEVDTNGVKHFELSLIPGSDSYRAFRLPWNGVVAAPYLVSEVQSNAVTLIYNKFGDTNVGFYRIYSGTSPNPTNLVAESAATIATISNLDNGPHYFRVTAVSTSGAESPFSNEENQNIHVIRPGENMLFNGDFSGGSDDWQLELGTTAIVEWSFKGGASDFTVSNGGSGAGSIQFQQTGLSLNQGSTYVLQFDAWSSTPNYLQAEVIQSSAPNAIYSNFRASFLSPNKTHFSYSFTMASPSDTSADLIFNMGGTLGDIYLANLSLFSPAPGDFNEDGRVNLTDLGTFCDGWLKQNSGSPADLDHNGAIDFRDFTVFGNNWETGGP